MSDVRFATDNYDLAMTKVAEGLAVSYTGPHQGVFRFESVKLAALMTLPPEKRPPLPPVVYCDPITSQSFAVSRENVARDQMKPAR